MFLGYQRTRDTQSSHPQELRSGCDRFSHDRVQARRASRGARLRELLDGQIRIKGTLQTRIELVCARCLDEISEEISRDFDLFYRPAKELTEEEAVRLKDEDTEVGFFQGEGMFLSGHSCRTDAPDSPHEGHLPQMVGTVAGDCAPHGGANMNSEAMSLRGPFNGPASGSAGSSEAGMVQEAVVINSSNPRGEPLKWPF